MKKAVAFIPARAGSKRIPHKNIKLLNEHPLIAYAITTTLESGVFDDVIVATDSQDIASIAQYYGASVPVLRPESISGSQSSDIEWVIFMLDYLKRTGSEYEFFSILRPTSPLRTSETIIKAWKTFLENPHADSIRAVEKCSQHPAKMWKLSQDNNRMEPLLVNPDSADVPWHSKQYAALPEIYVQNASLEIAKTAVPLEGKGIAGQTIVPFISDGYEGFDLNNPEDWIVLEHLISENKVELPKISKIPIKDYLISLYLLLQNT